MAYDGLLVSLFCQLMDGLFPEVALSPSGWSLCTTSLRSLCVHALFTFFRVILFGPKFGDGCCVKQEGEILKRICEKSLLCVFRGITVCS